MEKKHSDKSDKSITSAIGIARYFACRQFKVDKDLIRYIDLNMRY